MSCIRFLQTATATTYPLEVPAHRHLHVLVSGGRGGVPSKLLRKSCMHLAVHVLEHRCIMSASISTATVATFLLRFLHYKWLPLLPLPLSCCPVTNTIILFCTWLACLWVGGGSWFISMRLYCASACSCLPSVLLPLLTCSWQVCVLLSVLCLFADYLPPEPWWCGAGPQPGISLQSWRVWSRGEPHPPPGSFS